LTDRLYLSLALVAGLGYVVAVLGLKQAIRAGLGPWRLTVANSWIVALCYSPLFLLPGGDWAEIRWYQPLVVAVLLLTGNVLLLLALNRGDVSVATPILGTKVIFVAFLTVVVLGETVPLKWWIAAGLATAGIALLRTDESGGRRNLLATVVYSVGSAVLFALTDILIQKWVTPATFTRFVPVMCWMIALLSLGFVPFFRESLLAIPKPVWGYLGWGSCVLAGQSLLVMFILSRYGHATAVNIMYSTRGIWSVVLVWVFGRWIATQEERAADHQTMALRLVGASVLLVAVILVMI